LDPEHRPEPDAEARIVDASGHRCPMPLLLAKRALNGMQPGERLRVVATDPTAPRDFETFARQSGQLLLEVGAVDGVHHILLEKR